MLESIASLGVFMNMAHVLSWSADTTIYIPLPFGHSASRNSTRECKMLVSESGTFRVLSVQAALELLRINRDLHEGTLTFPSEILECKRALREATRNAELFLYRMRTVDYSMVDHVVNLKLELDRLYGQWAERRVEGVIH